MANSDIDFNSTTFDLNLPESVITESEIFVTPAPSLEDLAAQIKGLAKNEDDIVLRSALMAASIKARIIAGEAGVGVYWRDWMMRHIKISRAQLYALVRIGTADDPVEALEQYRREARERSKRRTVSPNHLSDAHTKLIRLVRLLGDSEAESEFRAMWDRYPNYQS